MADQISPDILDDPAALQRSLNGDKLALKKWEDGIKNANRQVLANNASQNMIDKMLRFQTSIHDKIEVMFAKCTRILELNDTDDDNINTRINTEVANLSKREDDMVNLVNATMRAWQDLQNLQAAQAPPAAGQNQGGAQAQVTKVKAKTELKPEVLNEEFTPGEFNMWKDSYLLYHTASNFAQLSLAEQRGYLFACMTKELRIRLQAKITGDLPVTEPNGVLAQLTSLFLEIDPLYSRRQDWFRLMQKDNQLASIADQELRRLTDHADILTLHGDEMYKFRLLSMITDKKLQLELLKLEDPTLEEVRTCIRNYERAILNQKDTSNRGL